MISDVLSDAVAKLDEYLKDNPDLHAGERRVRIIALRNRMNLMRTELDALPLLDDKPGDLPDFARLIRDGDDVRFDLPGWENVVVSVDGQSSGWTRKPVSEVLRAS